MKPAPFSFEQKKNECSLEMSNYTVARLRFFNELITIIPAGLRKRFSCLISGVSRAFNVLGKESLLLFYFVVDGRSTIATKAVYKVIILVICRKSLLLKIILAEKK